MADYHALFVSVGVLSGVVVLAPLHAIFFHVRPRKLEELQELQEEHRTQTERLLELERKDTTQQADLANLRATTEDEIATLRAQVASEAGHVATIAQLNQEVQTLRQGRSRAQTEATARRTQHSQALASIQSSLTQAEARAQAAQTEARSNEGEIRRLNREYTTLTEERDTLAHEARVGRARVTEVHTLQARLKQAGRMRTELEGRIDQMLTDHEVLNAHVRDLEKTNAEQQARNDDLTTRLTEMERRYELIRHQYLELRA